MKTTMKIKMFVFAIATALLFGMCVGAADITDLSQITDMNGSYTLVNDVVMDEGFSSIGSQANPFTGKFDGKGHEISGADKAIFAYADSAEIKNLIVAGDEGLSDSYFGGVVSYAVNTLIEGCSFKGTLTLDTDGLYFAGGGIAGFADEKSRVKGCTSDLTFTVTGVSYEYAFGGIVGENHGLVSECTSKGSITATTDKYMMSIGGIVGKNMKGAVIEHCFNKVSVSAELASESACAFVGGIAGCNRSADVLSSANYASISATGVTVYPVYAGGIVGINYGGTVDTVKNASGINAFKAIAGGIVGYNLGHKNEAYITDALNTGAFVKHDSRFAGITPENVCTDEENSSAVVEYALSTSSDKAMGEGNGETNNVYGINAEDGFSSAVTAEELKSAGIPILEKHKDAWVNNTEISALPDLLVSQSKTTSNIIASNKGDTGEVAYYMYSPDGNTAVKAFAAVFYNGSRYLGVDYEEATPSYGYARLKASDIPENTTRIRFIAFAESLDNAFKPAQVISAETEYSE